MNVEQYCPEIVLFLGTLLLILSLTSLLGIYKILIINDIENKRVSFALSLIGIALMAVSRL